MENAMIEKLDRRKWSNGPWDKEPDFVRYDNYPGLEEFILLIRRTSIGTLCGYVGVPRGHLLYGANISGGLWGLLEIAEAAPSEITYCDTWEEIGFSKDWWFIGFDCCHYGDKVPDAHMREDRSAYPTQYHTIEEVTQGCIDLGKTIKALKEGDNN